MHYFQLDELFVKIAEESVVTLVRNQEDGMKSYHRNGESVSQIFAELELVQTAFTEVTQKEYEEAIEVHRTYQPF